MSVAGQGRVRDEPRRRWLWADGALVREVRLPAALPIVIGVGLAAAALILFLTRRFDFYFDEWNYVLGIRDWDLGQYFVPHNEHWETIPELTYRGLIALFGTRSYLPYMAVLMGWTIVLAACLFLVVRRRSGDLPALAAACLMLLLGRGWENLIWADQIGFVGSSALGLLAVFLITGDDVPAWRGWLGSVVLLAAVMSTGPALFFVSWLLFELAFDRSERRRLLYLVVPIVAYLTWFAIIGRTTIDSHQNPLSIPTLVQLGPFVASGIGGSAATVLGVSPHWAMLAALVLGLVIGASAARHRPDWAVLGAGVGLVAEFVLVGSVRSASGAVQADAPRYLYIGAIFILIILADIAGRLRWRSPVTAAVVAVFLVGLILNGLYIPAAVNTRYTVSILPGQVSQQVAWAFRDAPGLDRTTSVDPVWMPTAPVSVYLAARALQGSPLPDVTPAGLHRYPADLVDRALGHLLPPQVGLSPHATPTCAVPGGPALSTVSSASVAIHTSVPGPVELYLWHYGSRPPQPLVTEPLVGPSETVIVAPARAESGFVWHLQAVGPPGASVTTCVSG